jgi:biotin--protein ligase
MQRRNRTLDRFRRLKLGIGINLLDTKPLMSISDAIKCHFPNLIEINSFFAKEEFLSRFMKIFHEYLQTFLQFGFDRNLKQKYLDRWLHSDQAVYLEEEGKYVKIIGLSGDGFLMAQDTDGLHSIFDVSGEKQTSSAMPVYHRISGAAATKHIHSIKRPGIYYLQPDGNSFDMMKGLIKRKA